MIPSTCTTQLDFWRSALTSGCVGPAANVDLQYAFSPTQNNGQIAAMTDAVSGEQVAYQYDTLKRLTRAETVGPQWGLEFHYDGFGNRRLINLIKGQSGPATNFQFDWKNQIGDPGFDYDANGNLKHRPDNMSFTCDVENRLRTAGSEVYEHHPLTGQRICSANCQKLYLYRPGGWRSVMVTYMLPL